MEMIIGRPRIRIVIYWVPVCASPTFDRILRVSVLRENNKLNVSCFRLYFLLHLFKASNLSILRINLNFGKLFGRM